MVCQSSITGFALFVGVFIGRDPIHADHEATTLNPLVYPVDSLGQ